MVRACRDTFVHFISDNLPDGITFHAIRMDPSDRSAAVVQANAVNVSFLNLTAGNDTAFCVQQAVIDVLNDDENTAVDWVSSVLDILRAAFYTPMSDYTVPTAPVPTGQNITWDRKRVTFKEIACDSYCHYSALLSLKFMSA